MITNTRNEWKNGTAAVWTFPNVFPKRASPPRAILGAHKFVRQCWRKPRFRWHVPMCPRGPRTPNWCNGPPNGTMARKTTTTTKKKMLWPMNWRCNKTKRQKKCRPRMGKKTKGSRMKVWRKTFKISRRWPVLPRSRNRKPCWNCGTSCKAVLNKWKSGKTATTKAKQCFKCMNPSKKPFKCTPPRNNNKCTRNTPRLGPTQCAKCRIVTPAWATSARCCR